MFKVKESSSMLIAGPNLAMFKACDSDVQNSPIGRPSMKDSGSAFSVAEFIN
jgi:hypothetical protein